jgi:hypothetical protein
MAIENAQWQLHAENRFLAIEGAEQFRRGSPPHFPAGTVPFRYPLPRKPVPLRHFEFRSWPRPTGAPAIASGPWAVATAPFRCRPWAVPALPPLSDSLDAGSPSALFHLLAFQPVPLPSPLLEAADGCLAEAA